MGFECMDASLMSKRLKGLSDILFAGKRKLLQAQTLTVQQVRILHSVLEGDDADAFDKAAAGFMLTAFYGRCRVSDLSFLDSIKHDHDDKGGFVELFTAVHKTGRSASKKATLLPILCPAVGVTGSNWVTPALQACESGTEFFWQYPGAVAEATQPRRFISVQSKRECNRGGKTFEGPHWPGHCCFRCQLSTCECTFTKGHRSFLVSPLRLNVA